MNRYFLNFLPQTSVKSIFIYLYLTFHTALFSIFIYFYAVNALVKEVLLTFICLFSIIFKLYIFYFKQFYLSNMSVTDWGRGNIICENYEQNNGRKNTLRCLNSRPQQRSQIQFKYFSEKLLLSQKTMLLQREQFLTIFYTINSSPLLVTCTK